MIKNAPFAPRVVTYAALFALVTACAGVLCSCTTSKPASMEEAVFKFTVLRYKEPVEVTGWVIDPAQSANPEGAAMNIVTAMQQEDMDGWLTNWDTADRPHPTKEERDALAKQWAPFKDSRVCVLDRVVAGGDIVIELSIAPPGQSPQKIQLPLKREEGQWWLTAMDPKSEFLNWETSNNKIVADCETRALREYLTRVKAAQAKAR